MCGICGFIGPAPGIWDRSGTLEAMKDRIVHRGPDDEGSFLDADAALGFRRLSIIDLASGHQPMTNEDGSVVVTFNGEIYNYQAIRDELLAAGHRFATNADTEVLVHGWEQWGEALLERLRGMFAFVIWDARTKTAFFARDFFGIKPLYYALLATGTTSAAPPSAPAKTPPAVSAGPASADASTGAPADASADAPTGAPADAPAAATLVYASEIKAILAYPGYDKQLNAEALDQYLSFQYSVLPETFFKGIFKLGPGECLSFHPETGACTHRRYFDPLPAPPTHPTTPATPAAPAPPASANEAPAPPASANETLEQAVERIKTTMRESVHAHMIADVEVGSLLSSGIDSSYITALYPNQRTYTVGFETADGERYNEINFAQNTAAELGKDNTSHIITPREYWDAIPRIMYHMDEPLADASAVALYFLDELVARDVKVVLSGEGADEFFGGYPIYHEPFSLAGYQRLPRFLRRVLAALARAVPGTWRGKSFLQRGALTVEERHIGNGYIFTVPERERLLRKRTARQTPEELCRPSYEHLAALRPGLDDTGKMQYLDYHFWLPGDILLKADKMSMAHSLESRVPFLDREVFALASTLPLACRVDDETTKVALRRAALEVLPPHVANKPKLGFPVPMRVWLKEDAWYTRVRETLTSETAAAFFDVDMLVALMDEHRAGGADNHRKIWTAYVFLIWYAVFFEDMPLEVPLEAETGAVEAEPGAVEA
ncbi:MAG: asparagine synthetase B [Coriobacteriales bacterium]|jgi:asparagine synthase (glutamine-hydrolysing)|nr:asparagine synthetase B [Coriobacteriales bacterium]